MLVTFHCKGYSSITMFGDVAIQLLKGMNHSGTVPSALSAEEVPQALSLLQSMVNQNPQSALSTADQKQQISIRQRALPLIGLLEYAVQEKLPVMWSS